MEELNEPNQEQSSESQDVSLVEGALQDRVWEHRSQEAREAFEEDLKFIERARNIQEAVMLFDQPYPGGAFSELNTEQIKAELIDFVERAKLFKEEYEKEGAMWGKASSGGDSMYYDNYRLAQIVLKKYFNL